MLKKLTVMAMLALVITAFVAETASATLVRNLWGSGTGTFRTVGSYSSATIRG